MNQEKSEKIVKKFIINCRKEYQPENFNIYKYLKYGKLDDIIESFNNTFEQRIGKERKKFFNTHIKHLKIKQVPGPCTISKKSTTGTYMPQKNTITIYGKLNDCLEVSERLMHELLHMSSNKANGLVDGLTISTKKNKLYGTTGSGLNEGYTELLNSRYFAMQEYYSGYRKEMVLAAGIEKLIGKDVMLDSYFRYTLFDLLIELNKYTESEKYSLDIINRIDNLYKAEDIKEKEKIYVDVKKDIVGLHRKKLIEDFASKKIDLKEFTKRNLFDIELYDKYNFIYDDYANIVDHGDKYMIMGNTGFFYISKENENAKAYMILKK